MNDDDSDPPPREGARRHSARVVDGKIVLSSTEPSDEWRAWLHRRYGSQQFNPESFEKVRRWLKLAGVEVPEPGGGNG